MSTCRNVGCAFVLLGLAAGTALGVTLVPAPTVDEPLGTSNWLPRSDHDVFAELRADYLRDVEPVLREHCYPCHVDSTFDRGEPWLAAHVDPIRHAVDEHVRLGVAALDLSTGFPFRTGEQPALDRQLPALRALEAALRDGSMPPAEYRMLHFTDRGLQPEQRDAVIDWAIAAQERLTGHPAGGGRLGRLSAELHAACGECHGPSRTISGPEITVLDELVAQRWVIPGQPDDSPVIQQIRSGSMPPNGAPPDGLVRALTAWIAEGAPLSRSARPAPTTKELLSAVRRDIEGLPAGRRPFVRYFSAEHLRAVRSSASEAAVAEDALRLTVGGLSKTPEHPTVHEVPLSTGGQVYRVDFSTSGWTQDEFDLIEAAYPLNWRPPGSAGTDADQIRAALSSTVGVFALDWFVRTVNLPPLYPELLDIPERMTDLSKKFDLDFCSVGTANSQALRAGFRNSGVSEFQRLIERHPTAFGSMWLSYDFGRRGDTADLFSYPLGPPCTGQRLAFEHDGNELIWSLPNGLLAYALYDADGHRLDIDAPRTIVQDGRSAITNAASCMGCHFAGLIPATDTMAGEARPDAIAPFAHLHAHPERLDTELQSDNARVHDALLAGGISPFHAESPIRVIRGRFEHDVPLTQLASLLGLEPSPETLARLGAAAGSGANGADAVPRVDLLRRFARLVESVAQGKAIPPSRDLPYDNQERLDQLPARTLESPFLAYGFQQVQSPGGPLFLGSSEISRAHWQRAAAREPDNDCLSSALLDQLAVPAFKLSGDDLPIVCISFLEAIDFANRLSRLEGLIPAYRVRDRDIRVDLQASGYRLPTESEWLAGLGGSSFVDDVAASSICGQANILSESDAALAGADLTQIFPCTDGVSGLSPIEAFAMQPSSRGLVDMTGNAAEWAWPDDAESVPLDGAVRVMGGSWLSGMHDSHAGTVVRLPAGTRSAQVGLRLARSAKGRRGERTTESKVRPAAPPTKLQLDPQVIEAIRNLRAR